MLQNKLKEKIVALEGVSEVSYEGKNGTFSSFVYKEKEFAHFHNENELDLRLTKKVIASEGVSHPEDSKCHPKRSRGSQWIELRFNNEKEMDSVLHYVKLAIAQIK